MVPRERDRWFFPYGIGLSLRQVPSQVGLNPHSRFGRSQVETDEDRLVDVHFHPTSPRLAADDGGRFRGGCLIHDVDSSVGTSLHLLALTRQLHGEGP